MKIFGLGLPELLIILAVALLIFGPKHLPKLGAALGSTVKNLRDGLGADKKDEEDEEEEIIEEEDEEEVEKPVKKTKALEGEIEEPKKKKSSTKKSSTKKKTSKEKVETK